MARPIMTSLVLGLTIVAVAATGQDFRRRTVRPATSGLAGSSGRSAAKWGPGE